MRRPVPAMLALAIALAAASACSRASEPAATAKTFTIVDANLTTLIAAVLLYAFGSGPVRGFAVTLGIGIITSMFTAITFTRLLMATWFRRTRPAMLPV